MGRMLLRGESVRQRLALSANLTAVRAHALLPGWGGRLPQFQRFNDQRFVRALCRAAQHVPPHRCILWYYYPQYLELIGALEPGTVVYDCMDNYTALFSRKDVPTQAPYRLGRSTGNVQYFIDCLISCRRLRMWASGPCLMSALAVAPRREWRHSDCSIARTLRVQEKG